MVSGGGSGVLQDKDQRQKLRESLQRRKKRAEEKRQKLREAIVNAGDDGILEGIYDNMQVRCVSAN